MSKSRIENAEVAAVFAGYPPAIRTKVLKLRALILSTASRTQGVGPLEETLRWGEPSYIPSQSKSGSLVRIGWKPAAPDRYALHFHCQTSLVETFRRLYPTTFDFTGNRSLTFAAKDALLLAPLRHCIALALTVRLGRQLDARYTIALARPRDVPALASIERAAGRIFESRVAASLFEQTVDEDDFRAARSGHREITLTTFRDIPWNLPFYARLGFEEIPAGDLDLELAALVREEASRGLDPALRAVMRLRVP